MEAARNADRIDDEMEERADDAQNESFSVLTLVEQPPTLVAMVEEDVRNPIM